MTFSQPLHPEEHTPEPGNYRLVKHGKPRIIEWKYMEDCILQDEVDGEFVIIHNSFQTDIPVIRQLYSDGTYVCLSAKTGKILGRPFKMERDGNQIFLPVESFKLSYMIEVDQCPTSPTPSSHTTDTASTTRPTTESTTQDT